MVKKYIGYLILGAIVIIAVVFMVRGKNEGQPSASGTPSSSITPNPSVSASASSTPVPFLGLTGLKFPATCTLEGEVVFIAPNLSENRGAKISWKNVDIASRNITWKITPNADLGPGPNLFASLKLPDGSETVTVRMPEKPADSYKLTASVGYGQVINGNVVVKNAACSGFVTVRRQF